MLKPGVKNDIANYRPNSLLPKSSWVFERLLFNVLYEKVRHYLSPSQIGLQSHKRAVLQLLDFTETLKFIKF